MTQRITDRSALRSIQQQIYGLEQYLHASELEPNLLHLIKMRASQINGCAYCLALHAKDLREAGEREDRIYVLDAWRETDWFTDRERAALAFTEAVTTLANKEVPDEVFEMARAQFSEKDLADLTLAVIAINAWNRINVTYHTPPAKFTITPKEAVAAD